MIKWILFDQAKVQTHNVFSNKSIFKINGKCFKTKDLEEIFYTKDYLLYSVGKISEKNLIKKYIQQKKLNITLSEYISLFKQGISPISGMDKILAKLNKKYFLAALINEGIEWADYKFEISDFKKYFKIIITSGHLKCAKPDLNFFKKSLKIINANPDECIFIDDQKINCEAAESIGIKSIVFTNSKQLIEDLRKSGIKIIS